MEKIKENASIVKIHGTNRRTSANHSLAIFSPFSVLALLPVRGNGDSIRTERTTLESYMHSALIHKEQCKYQRTSIKII